MSVSQEETRGLGQEVKARLLLKERIPGHGGIEVWGGTCFLEIPMKSCPDQSFLGVEVKG